MKILFLYGPPAVGKLSVGKRVAAATGMALFHNHMATNLASSILAPHGWEEYSPLASEIRIAVVKAVLATKVPGLVMTYAFGLETYKGKHDLDFVRRLQRETRHSEAELYFVKLAASPTVLSKRISDPGRRTLNKLTDRGVLQALMQQRDLSATIPLTDSLEIDTALTSIADSVAQIMDYCGARPLALDEVESLKPLQRSVRNRFRYLLD